MYGAEERAKPDRLRDELETEVEGRGMGREEVREGRGREEEDGKVGGGRRRDGKGGGIWVFCNSKSTDSFKFLSRE